MPRLLGIGFALVLSVFGAPESPRFPMETYTYKTVGSLELKADVYRPTGSAKRHPVLVYIHGGSLINGNRQGFGRNPFYPLFIDAGYVVVSIDYRLAPETKLPDLVGDVEDAFRWVREKGPSLFGADPGRIASAGTSAGGYLALVTGFRVHPRPFAIIAEASYGDLLGEWQMKPSIHPPHYESHLTEAEAWQQVSGPPVASSKDRKGDGGEFNDFVRRTAQWPKAISGWDPKTQADRYLPYLPLRNVTKDFPPTILVHSHDDTDVPRQQPEAMAAAFEKNHVAHKLILIPNSEHGYHTTDPKLITAAHREAFEFVNRHLREKGPTD